MIRLSRDEVGNASRLMWRGVPSFCGYQFFVSLFDQQIWLAMQKCYLEYLLLQILRDCTKLPSRPNLRWPGKRMYLAH